MIRTLSLSLAASMMAVGAYAQSFTIKGTIPGVKNGTKVKLRAQESGKDVEAQCLTKGSTFVLTGKVESPMLVELQINDRPENAYKQDDFAEDRGGKFMLEAGNYIVSAVCYDSIARNYDMMNPVICHEKNLKIVGGKAQQQYQEWADATYDARLKAESLDKQLRNARFRDRSIGGSDTVTVSHLQPLSDAAGIALDKANEEFVAAHPDYVISLLLMNRQIEKPFAFQIADYDKMLAAFADNYDKARYAEFQKTVAEMKQYIKGDHYKDLILETEDGKSVNLKDVVIPGKYNFIDFWASWCGPCRAAIPSVKKMHQNMGDKLNIISVSVDKRRQDWEEAMKEEKMPWGQFLVPQTSMKALKDGYYVRFVPSLVIVDSEGKIQLFTNDPQKAHAYLEQKMK